MKSIFITLLLVIPVVVWAGEDDLKQAEQLFQESQYEKALAIVAHVFWSSDIGPEQLVEAYRIKGLCLSAIGPIEGAVKAFRQLLAINPNFRLSRDISPKLTPPFFKALAIEQKPISLAHQPPTSVKSLAGKQIEVVLQDDPLGMVNRIRLIFWGQDGKESMLEESVEGPGKLLLNLPQDIMGNKVSYYFEAMTRSGGVLKRLGNKERPFDLQISAALPALVLDRPLSGTEMLSTAALPASASEPEKKTTGRPFYKTWWFWTTVGVVVVGATTGAAIAITKGQGSNGGSKDYVVEFK